MIEFNLSQGMIQAEILDEYVSYVLHATSFCLAKNEHISGVESPVQGDITGKMKLYWDPIPAKVTNTFGNPSTATEKGAEGLAFIVMDRFTDYKVGSISYIGSGFDFYLLPKAEVGSLLALNEGYMKLEVSGIDKKSPTNNVDKRIKEKCQQAATIKDGKGFYVVVAEFSDPVVEVKHGNSV